MHSVRASPAFAIVVLVTLALFGLIGVVLVQPNLIAGLLGQNVAGHISGHFRSLDHRVHDVTFSFLVGTAAVGMLAQLRTPSQNVAGQLMALIPWVALTVTFALTNKWVFAPLPILGGLTLLATILHPTGRDFLRSFSVSRVNRVMLGLVIIAAVPLLAFAATNIGLQMTVSNDHAALGHYGFMAAFNVTVFGVGLLVSLRPDGWRLTAWVGGLLPAVLGLASVVFPDNESSLGLIWALAAIAWAVGFVAAAEFIRRGGRAIADLPAYPDPNGNTRVGPDRGSTTSTPRWVYVSGLIVIGLGLLFVGLHLTGGGLGGPGLHTPPSSVADHGVQQP